MLQNSQVVGIMKPKGSDGMLTRKELSAIFEKTVLLDGATGSNLQKAGMPRGCCTEEWILANPEAIIALQRSYAEAGSQTGCPAAEICPGG